MALMCFETCACSSKTAVVWDFRGCIIFQRYRGSTVTSDGRWRGRGSAINGRLICSTWRMNWDMLTIGYAFNRKDTEELMHPLGVAVEGELTSLPGVGGELSAAPEETDSDDPGLARDFVQRTGIDAFAVNIGQAHLHGRNQVRLNLCRLAELRKRISVPLVLHGTTSISQSDLKEAIQLGVRKVNVGSILKRSYFEAVRRACSTIGPEYNPYEVVGSGLEKDVLTAGRVALQKVVKELMKLLGSAGRA